MTEKSAQEKLAELDQRDSNAETVESIATTGHIASTGIMAVSMVGATAKVGLAAAAANTCAAGIAKAVAGFGGPLIYRRVWAITLFITIPFWVLLVG